MMKTSIAGGACMMVLALSLGCGSGGGEGGGGGTTTASSSGGSGGAVATYGTGPCRACVTTACADEIDACKADPECPAFLACLDACPATSGGDADPDCAAACPTGSGSESKKAAMEINLCRAKGAGVACEACGLTPSTTYTSPVLNQDCPSPSTQTDPCYICRDEKCCDTYLACHDDPDCQALFTCFDGCAEGDDACWKTCTEQHPSGSNLLGPSSACVIVLCSTECNGAPLQGCEACFYLDCGDAYAEYVAAPGGFAMQECVAACPVDDTACDKQCYDAYPEAYQKYGDLASCLSVVCKDEC